MNINKTVDETIVENAKTLLKCCTDSSLSLQEKQKYTKWISWFLDYQDAININNQAKIIFLEQKLNLNSLPIYYQNALQEFKNCNLFYCKINDFKELTSLFINYSNQITIKNINDFIKIFLDSFQKYKVKLTNNFSENFQILIYTTHYHLSYLFSDQLNPTVTTLIDILQKKVLIAQNQKPITLFNLILKENEIFFNEIQEIQLINFIFQLEEIFETTQQSKLLNSKIKQLIFNQPKKLKISMNNVLTENNIKLYDEIWKNNLIDEKKSKLLMHLFAYETYFLQGHNHHEIYEDLVLKKIIDEDKYWTILHQYKSKNEIID